MTTPRHGVKLPSIGMDGEQHPERVALRRAREAVIEHLSECFARDELSLEDFESRLDRAYVCTTESELGTLLVDLRAAAGSSLMPVPGSTAAELATVSPPSGAPPAPRFALAVFGNVERRARGVLPPGARVLAVFGNVELDLRELSLPPGVTELHVRAVFGNVEITLPPTLAVECRGSPVFGSFTSLQRLPSVLSGEAVLRVIGTAVFGNVEVRTLPRRALLQARRITAP